MRYVVSGSFPGGQQMQLPPGMQAVPIQQVQRVVVQQAPVQQQPQNQQMPVGYVIKQTAVAQQQQQPGSGTAGGAATAAGVVPAQRPQLQYQASTPGVAAPGAPTDASQQRPPQLHLVPTGGHAPHLASGQMIAARTATLPGGTPSTLRFAASVQPTALPLALPVQQPTTAHVMLGERNVLSDGVLFTQQSTQLLPVTQSMAPLSAMAQQQAAGGPLRVLYEPCYITNNLF